MYTPPEDTITDGHTCTRLPSGSKGTFTRFLYVEKGERAERRGGLENRGREEGRIIKVRGRKKGRGKGKNRVNRHAPTSHHITMSCM